MQIGAAVCLRLIKIPPQGFKCKKYGKDFWQNLPLWCTVERRCHFSICTNSSCCKTCRDIGIGLFYQFGIHLWYWTGSQLFLNGSQLIFPGKKMELTPNWLTATTLGRITLLNLLRQNRHTLRKKKFMYCQLDYWVFALSTLRPIHLYLIFEKSKLTNWIFNLHWLHGQ